MLQYYLLCINRSIQILEGFVLKLVHNHSFLKFCYLKLLSLVQVEILYKVFSFSLIVEYAIEVSITITLISSSSFCFDIQS